jgi:hypothetical protein
MVLNHLAAILLFSGPLFYIGLWMVVDPAGLASIPEVLLGNVRTIVQNIGGAGSPEIRQVGYADSRSVQRLVRFAGIALLIIAVAV